MRTETLVWAALAIGFLALALFAYLEVKFVDSKARMFAGDAPSERIGAAVAHALKRLLVVELAGFVLAAAAAIFTAVA
jgi:hypothetical protein